MSKEPLSNEVASIFWQGPYTAASTTVLPWAKHAEPSALFNKPWSAEQGRRVRGVRPSSRRVVIGWWVVWVVGLGGSGGWNQRDVSGGRKGKQWVKGILWFCLERLTRWVWKFVDVVRELACARWFGVYLHYLEQRPDLSQKDTTWTP